MIEADTLALVKLEASRKGLRLWRNNVGAVTDARGNFYRYGLANETAAMNASVKSGDLIGIRPTLVTPAMIGATLGVFVSRECKRPGWRWAGTPRELAQFAWVELVTGLGGDAGFATGEGTL